MKPIRLLPLGLLVACSSSSPQVITGKIDTASFASPIHTVKVTTSNIQSWHGNAEVTRATVAADGTFRLEVLPMGGLHIQLIAENGQSTLLFPRTTGSMQRGFTIRPGGGAFDLGTIRFLGDPTTAQFAFKPAAGDPECEDDGEDAGGMTCVDDDDQNEDGQQNQCGENEDGEANNDDGDNNNDDGDNTDNTDDENEGNEDQDDGQDVGDSVAEHNFPADGCAGEDNDNNDEGEGEGGDDDTEDED